MWAWKVPAAPPDAVPLAAGDAALELSPAGAHVERLRLCGRELLGDVHVNTAPAPHVRWSTCTLGARVDRAGHAPYAVAGGRQSERRHVTLVRDDETLVLEASFLFGLDDDKLVISGWTGRTWLGRRAPRAIEHVLALRALDWAVLDGVIQFSRSDGYTVSVRAEGFAPPEIWRQDKSVCVRLRSPVDSDAHRTTLTISCGGPSRAWVPNV